MSDLQPDEVPAEVADAARVRLAEWLTAQVPDEPELAATPEDLANWAVRREQEFLLFVPPGYANQIFLVGEQGISAYAPSMTSLDEALAEARAAR